MLCVSVCTHAGCPFVGGRADIEKHKECSFNNDTQLIAVTMKEVCVASPHLSLSPHTTPCCS